jgi:hypothetical protein
MVRTANRVLLSLRAASTIETSWFERAAEKLAAARINPKTRRGIAAPASKINRLAEYPERTALPESEGVDASQ